MAISSYFDVDEVLAAEEVVPIVFNTACFMIGKEAGSDIIARTADGERIHDIQPGSKATVPHWVARPFRASGFASVQSLPVHFQTMVFREFKLDPLAPNLRSKSPYYFEHGLMIASMLPPNESVRLRKQLQRLFQVRFFPILSATAKKGFDFQDVRETLTGKERWVLDSVRNNEIAEASWRTADGLV